MIKGVSKNVHFSIKLEFCLKNRREREIVFKFVMMKDSSDKKDINILEPKRIFVLGDIHGCRRELVMMLDFLDKRIKLNDEDLVIFLGDYIDRGLESKEVIAEIINFKGYHENAVFLKGNHEEMFLSFLGLGGSRGEVFLQNGGRETLQSYGCSINMDVPTLLDIIGEQHLDFYQGLENWVKIEDFLFVHAGLNPDIPLEEHSNNEYLWIRKPFLESDRVWDYLVVFGHTPQKQILNDMPRKLGIDTGLVFGNILSCVEMRSGDVYQVKKNGWRVKHEKNVLDIKVPQKDQSVVYL